MTTASIPSVYELRQDLYTDSLVSSCLISTKPPFSPTIPPYPPRSTPRPTDQRSGELGDPALTAFLGIPNDEADIDFAPVPPDLSPCTCPHCQRPVRDEDNSLATPLATDHGLLPHLCLNCTLEELELLSPYTEAEDGMPVVFFSLLAA